MFPSFEEPQWRTSPTTKTTTVNSGTRAAANLAPAAASIDPVAQALLAELQTARLNGNDEDAKKVVDRLAGLGYGAE